MIIRAVTQDGYITGPGEVVERAGYIDIRLTEALQESRIVTPVGLTLAMMPITDVGPNPEGERIIVVNDPIAYYYLNEADTREFLTNLERAKDADTRARAQRAGIEIPSPVVGKAS